MTTAHNGIKNDEKVKQFYDEVKAKYDEIIAKEEAAKKAKEEEEKKGEKVEERVKMDDIDEDRINKIEEEMKEATPELFQNQN